jgi:CRP-like cAMP-binding protein
MTIQTKSLISVVEKHPLFAELDPEYLELIAGCASNVRFSAGQQILREGEPANHFYLLRFGRVSVEVYAPGRGHLTIQTLHPGDVLGWSWLVKPYRWNHDARAMELTRALKFDGACIRMKSEEEPRLGYELMKRFAPLIARRLQRAELQLLDVYGDSVKA